MKDAKIVNLKPKWLNEWSYKEYVIHMSTIEDG